MNTSSVYLYYRIIYNFEIKETTDTKFSVPYLDLNLYIDDITFSFKILEKNVMLMTFQL